LSIHCSLSSWPKAAARGVAGFRYAHLGGGDQFIFEDRCGGRMAEDLNDLYPVLDRKREFLSYCCVGFFCN